MKKLQLIAAMLVLAIMMSLCACSSSTKTAETVDSTGNTESTPQESQEPQAQEPETEETASTIVWPLDETVTLTVFWPWVTFYNSVGIEDMSQSIYYEELEKRLNVKLDRTLVGEEYSTTFMLMCASGEFTDIITSADSNYTTGYDACVEDDIIIDIAPYLEQYAPNYYVLLNSDENIKKQATTDSGYVTGFKYIYNEAQTNRNINAIRKDLLDQLGLDVPTTLDEAHEVLTAFKNEFDMDCALLCDATGTSSYIQTAFGPYGLYLDDGKVVYDYRNSNFKDYITYTNQLYNEGIINRDFASMDVGANYRDYINGGRTCVATGVLFSDFNQYEQDGVVDLVSCPPLLMDANVKSENGDIPVYVNSANTACISTQCEELEVALAYYDYNYSEEGALLANYGVEGKTFEYDDAGKPQYTEYVTDNPNGIPQTLVLMYDCCWACGYLLDVHNQDATLTQDELEACAIYQTAFSGTSQTYPSSFVTLTADESSTASGIETDLDTFMEENIAKFVTGEYPMSEFDAFVENIYANFDVDSLLEIYTNAYERYLQR